METSKDIDYLYRKYYGKLVASLVSHFNLAIVEEAEDVVQETFITAQENWKIQFPDDPLGWLYKVCKNKMINLLKSKKWRSHDFLPLERQTDWQVVEQETEDYKLRILFATCNPKLTAKSQIIFTLKTIAGFKISEIAAALAMQEEAVSKSLKRTRKYFRDNNTPFKIPYLLQSESRLKQVLLIIYLIFNEGYRSKRAYGIINQNMLIEAKHLCEQLLVLPIKKAHAYALYSLLLFHLSRLEAMITEGGSLVDLENQDRNLWSKSMISLGFHYLNLSKQSKQISRYHLEAGIAAVHCQAKSFEETNWQTILKYYDNLIKISNSPFVQLNRIIAVSYSISIRQAIDEIQQLDDTYLSKYYLFYATKANLLERAQQIASARIAYLKAWELSPTLQEKELISKKLLLLEML